MLVLDMSAHPVIAIIGAGLGGLCTAQILFARGIPCTIYEAELSASHRPQGGSLDLQPESGQRALELAGLLAAFNEISRPEDDCSRFVDKHNTVHLEHSGRGARPEVDRAQLRALLLNKLDGTGVLKWDHKVVRVHRAEGGNGQHIIDFANGTSTSADLIVGADGTWSKVRPLLSPTQPEYTGVSFIAAEIVNVDAAAPDVAATVGRGTVFVLDDNKCLIPQRNGNGNVCIYIGVRGPVELPEELVGTGPAGLPAAGASAGSDVARAQAVSRLKAVFADWDPALLALLDAADGPLVPRALFALPTGHTWPHVRGLTLLGDAAHVMSPFAGEGANLAMLDGAELALAIAEPGPDGWDAAVRAHEARMLARAAESAAESAKNLEIFISDGGARAAAAAFRAMIAERMRMMGGRGGGGAPA
jgi:2-polyprenyl-6-methoxyphenol hydroxylase-like FAD-dependent oxidoreductase